MEHSTQGKLHSQPRLAGSVMSPRSVAHFVVLCGCAAIVACSSSGGNTTPDAPPVADTTPPDTTIVTVPPAVTNQSAVSITFTSTESGTFEASLDGAAFTATTSPFVASNLADGAHTFRVRARDAAGNFDATPATHNWTIDTVAPVATITGGPPAETTSTSATITFTTEPGTTVQAFTPTAGPIDVTSPLQLTGLTDGFKTVALRALDAAGNLQLVAAGRVWRVDTTAPTAQIVFPTAVSYTDEADVAVRATITDAGTVSAVSVNGVAATLLSGNTYVARVPVALGVSDLTVATADNLGNSTINAASVNIANRGPVLYDMRAVVWDAAGNRALVADMARQALIALRGSDGRASILSDDDHGTGPSFSGSFPITLDAANNRVLALQGSGVLAIDLATGNRTTVVASPGSSETAFVTRMVCASPCTRLYAAGFPSNPISSDSPIFTIDLANGARSVFSGGDFHVGAGTSIKQPTGIVLDNSTGTLRALVSDSFRDALFAVNLTTGDRTIVSSASAGTGTAFEAPGGLSLDAANNRVFVVDNRSSDDVGRLFSVNLATGDRTLLVAPAASTTFRSLFDPHYDAANNRVLVAQFRPTSVAQVPLGTPAVNRFSDSFVGTGASPRVGGSLLLDTRTIVPTLLVSTPGFVLRLNLLHGRPHGCRRNEPFAERVSVHRASPAARLPRRAARGSPDHGRHPAPTRSVFMSPGSSGVFSRLSSATVPDNATVPEFQYDASEHRHDRRLHPARRPPRHPADGRRHGRCSALRSRNRR